MTLNHCSHTREVSVMFSPSAMAALVSFVGMAGMYARTGKSAASKPMAVAAV